MSPRVLSARPSSASWDARRGNMAVAARPPRNRTQDPPRQHRFSSHACEARGRRASELPYMNTIMNPLLGIYARLLCDSREAWWALPLRLAVGFGFVEHGYAKLARGADSFIAILQALH